MADFSPSPFSVPFWISPNPRFPCFSSFRGFRQSSTEHLVCSCLSCLRRFFVLVISVVFVKCDPHANHRFRSTRLKLFAGINYFGITPPLKNILSFLSLLFLFFSLRGFSCFLHCPFFCRHFRGSVGIRNPCFLGGFSLPFFPKEQGKEGHT